ncbi:MAG: Crp/Fnr family transcriptional regulator [Chloroflexi bacterium]|nr:Crp/Fnr family transcriptional regulator [Chloroflexota bacterium]
MEVDKRMTVKAEILQTVDFLAGLTPQELEAIRRFFFERTLERNELLFLEGEKPEALYAVISGRIRLFKTSAEGKEQVVRIRQQGESFNYAAVFGDSANPASAMAMGPSLIYGIRKSDVDGVVKAYPKVSANVIRIFANKLRQQMSLVEDLSFRHVTSRVAKILLEYAEDTPAGKSEEIVLKHPLTQQDMAAMVGTAREMVGRSLKSLESQGAIKTDGHRIAITDKRLLLESV